MDINMLLSISDIINLNNLGLYNVIIIITELECKIV